MDNCIPEKMKKRGRTDSSPISLSTPLKKDYIAKYVFPL